MVSAIPPVESNYSDDFAGFELRGSIVPDRLVIEQGLAKVVTVPAGTGKLVRGTVLGAVTASGDYIPSTKAATDGSQVMDAILADYTDASGTADVQAVVFYTGRYNLNAITIGAGYVAADVVAAFRTKSMFFETSLT